MTLMTPASPTELLPQPNGNGAGTVPAPVVAAAAAALDIKAFREGRPSRETGDPTPRDAGGKAKRFRGNRKAGK